MGCGESKIKQIHLSPDSPDHNNRNSSSNTPHQLNLIEEDELLQQQLPNRLLSALAVSDLGDSLDSRHLNESLNLSHKFVKAPDSADSTDSGFDDYDEEYSHIITERSSPDKVRQVEAAFRPVDLPELLVITGRACARILSGYQKNKQDEARIMDTLREEGLLAKPAAKTNGGMSFEVVDAETHDESNADTTFVSAQFVPRKKLERLEFRRVNLRKPSAHITARLAEADERRRIAEEEKVKQVLERSGLERHGRMKSASAASREGRYSATVANRKLHLQEMRDKLKEKHKKNDMIRLKHQLTDSMVLESGFSKSGEGFFDD